MALGAEFPHGNYITEQLCPECVENNGSHYRSYLEKVHLTPKVKTKQKKVAGRNKAAEPVAVRVVDGVKTLGRLVTLLFQTFH